MITTIILICNIFHLSNADSHICSGISDNCPGSIIQCKPNEPCDITCTAWGQVCLDTQINCPDNHNCTLLCDAQWACEMLTIYARSSYQLSITCTGWEGSCENIAVHCPPNVANSKRCVINSGDQLYGVSYGEQVLGFYAINGWNDLDIIYSGTWTNGNTADQQMYCTSNYSESCNIATGSWSCENVQDICNNPPTPEPTTSISITSLPTSSIPTTFVPTTSIPTTSIPTSVPSKPTTMPSSSPIFAPTISPETNADGEIDYVYTTADGPGTKENLNKTDDSMLYLLMALAALAGLIIISATICILMLFQKRKRHNNENIKVLDKSPIDDSNNKGLANIGEIQLTYTNEGNNDAMENENKNNDGQVQTSGRWYSPEIINKKQEDDIYSDEINGVEPIIKKEDKWKYAFHLDKTPQHEGSIHNENNNKQEVTIGNNSGQITHGDELPKAYCDNNNDEHNSGI